MIVVGTRPEIIKMAPVIDDFQRHDIKLTLLHSQQHYDHNMSKTFYDELGLNKPDVTLDLRGESQVAQTSLIMMQLEEFIGSEMPDLMIVQGDTNTMLASALTALKIGIPVGHVEAGLRSYDPRMPEEHNRRMVDHVSSILFAPTPRAEITLKKENVPGSVYVTGNTVIDAIIRHMPMAERQSKIMDSIDAQEFILTTVHRKENVDNPIILRDLIESFMESPLPIVFPIHPRTVKSAKENGLWRKLNSSKNVKLIPPVGYFDFLMLMRNCSLILTDSGGIQEEATAPPIRKRVLITRTSTERPEAIESGFATIVGVDKERILEGIKNAIDDSTVPLPESSPFGDGMASERIVTITSEFTQTNYAEQGFLHRIDETYPVCMS